MSVCRFSAAASGVSNQAVQRAERSAEQGAVFDALVSRTDWGNLGGSAHVLQVYEEDAHLLDAVHCFTSIGLTAGEAVVVIATPPHREQLEAHLHTHGVDVATARAQGQYIPLDAAETLTQFMVDGRPDAQRFAEVVGGIMARAESRYARVRAFGEMVALLWEAGHGDAALQLEGLWTDLATRQAMALLCAYPLHSFARAGDAPQFLTICTAHSHVLPAESYPALASPDACLRTIVQLQQQARALKAEVAERQALEQVLRRREQELADFFDNAPLGLHWVSPDGIILRVNQAELHLLGYTRDDYVGHHITEFYADSHESTDILRRLHAGEELHDYEARLICKDGTIKHVLVDSNVLWEQGQFIHTRCFTRDITTQKRAKAALQQAYAELEQRVEERTAALQHEMVERQQAEAQLRQQQAVVFQHEKLATMGTLLASVAHELNNPLAIIMMQADLMHEEQHDAQAEPVKAITQAAERCMRIVRNFLTLARQHSPERHAVALNTVVEGAMELLAYGLQADTIMVDWQLAPDLPQLWADSHQLHQVIVNLVTNAQQALREVPSPRRLTLTTRADPEQACVLLEVADTGPGMAPALQAQIFEPFFTTKPSGEGTGLGLPLCRGIIEGHAGSISVQSQPGQGTVFRIVLPVQAVESAPEEPQRLEATLPVDGAARTILVVDDEPGIARALAHLLRRDGYTVDTAANGRLALTRLRAQPYDLLLCDLRMPDLDGPGLYQALQQQHPHLLPRVIFLTGDTLSPEVRTFLEQAGVPHLSKPCRAAEVRRLVSQVLQDTRA